MSLKILVDKRRMGILTIQLDNGDYKVLNEIVSEWGFKDRENALRFALAILSETRNGTLCKKEDDKTHTILVPTDEILGGDNASKE
jgi:hypothetical protein